MQVISSPQCVFCQIVKEKLPCYKVYEDADFLGFLDIRPLNPGNTILIPKTHYRWVTDVPAFGRYFEVAKDIAVAIQKTLGAYSVNLLTIGEEVPHAHIRIIPRFADDQGVFELKNFKTIPPRKMEQIAQTIYVQIGRKKEKGPETG